MEGGRVSWDFVFWPLLLSSSIIITMKIIIKDKKEKLCCVVCFKLELVMVLCVWEKKERGSWCCCVVLCCVVLCVTWDDGKVLEFQVASDETEGGKWRVAENRSDLSGWAGTAAAQNHPSFLSFFFLSHPFTSHSSNAIKKILF